jgi:AcrR family transcriptional regulator
VPTTTPRPGRRLDASRDAAIQSAVVQVLAEAGYGGLTMDAVAAAAGVSKATIYRRWQTKEALLVSVVDRASDDTLITPDTGSLRDDLVQLLSSLAGVLGGPGGNASRALLGALNDEPTLAAAFRQGPMARWAEAFITVLERGAARGEMTSDPGVSLGAEAGPAILVLRWLIRGAPIEDEVATAVVDRVMMPLLGN